MDAACVITVAYANTQIDLTWVPEDTPVVIVHNDTIPVKVLGSPVRLYHLQNPTNVGFGAAVNRAAALCNAKRIVVCNPDTSLEPQHWRALVEHHPTDVVTLPLNRPDGTPTAVAEPYPGPGGLLWKVAANGTSLRNVIAWWKLARSHNTRQLTQRHLRRGASDPFPHRVLKDRRSTASKRWTAPLHVIKPWSVATAPGRHPLRNRWISGAVFSVDRARFLAVGGFDERFFLYFEDMDLCRRLAEQFPDSAAVIAAVAPGVHQVGGSARSASDQTRARQAWLCSGGQYADTQPGWLWKCVRIVLWPWSGNHGHSYISGASGVVKSVLRTEVLNIARGGQQ